MPPTDNHHSPDDFAGLEPSERLLVWALRRWVSGVENWNLVWREFSRLLPAPEAHAAMRGFEHLIAGICRFARRPFRYHQPLCPCVGTEEASFVALVAAAQANHEPLTQALAEWLVQRDGVADLTEAARGLSAALAAGGFILPQRRRGAPEPADAAEWPAAATLH